MILGIGIDLEEVTRIGESINRFGDQFLERIFTPDEIAFCSGKANSNERFAARFAAKEAAFKALQATWADGLSWRDFELVARPGGAPQMVLHRVAARIAGERGMVGLHVSFSHTKTHVSAVVIVEGV